MHYPLVYFKCHPAKKVAHMDAVFFCLEGGKFFSSLLPRYFVPLLYIVFSSVRNLRYYSFRSLLSGRKKYVMRLFLSLEASVIVLEKGSLMMYMSLIFPTTCGPRQIHARKCLRMEVVQTFFSTITPNFATAV